MRLGCLAPAGALSIDVSDRVYFASGSAELDDAARRTLDRTSKNVATFPADIGLTIFGHTEEKEVPSIPEAFALGERRAQAVRDYLVAKGIAPERIRTWSYGWERPQVVGGDTSWNRRAVARFWELSRPASRSSDFYDYETKTAFDRVFFASGSAELDDTAKRVLDRQFRKASDYLLKFTGHGLSTTGHTDHKEVPGGRESLALGERRARAVKNYLVSKGIAPKRINIWSYGWYRPAMPPSGDSSKNRRVVTEKSVVFPARTASIDLFRGFHRVFFASGSAEHDDAAKRVLDRQFRKADSFYTDLEITITGHTDKKEVPGHLEAVAFGKRRAQAVKDYLVSKGLAPEQIDTLSFGWYWPAVPTSGDSPKNRRTVTRGRSLQ